MKVGNRMKKLAFLLILPFFMATFLGGCCHKKAVAPAPEPVVTEPAPAPAPEPAPAPAPEPVEEKG